MSNDLCIAIIGESASGKSASLRNIKNAVIANCEAGKRLPFKLSQNNLVPKVITDPNEVLAMFDWLKKPEQAQFDYAIIDGLNFMMDMYESIHVLPSDNTMQAWGEYAQFFKKLMQQKVAACEKKVIFTAHTRTVYNEEAMAMETSIPIKGALKNQGLEAYFSTIVAAKRVSMNELEEYEEGNDLLNITDRERKLGYKHVFQTQPTVKTITEKMRAPMGMFTDAETYMDNDAALVFTRLEEYYA